MNKWVKYAVTSLALGTGANSSVSEIQYTKNDLGQQMTRLDASDFIGSKLKDRMITVNEASFGKIDNEIFDVSDLGGSKLKDRMIKLKTT